MKSFAEFIGDKKVVIVLCDWFSKSSSDDGTPGWVQLGGKYAGNLCKTTRTKDQTKVRFFKNEEKPLKGREKGIQT